MTTDKKELAVAALRNGTVDKSVTVGNNLPSRQLGTKGIIKIADTEFAEDVLNRIALIAPTAVVNTIRNFEVAEKRPVRLPDDIIGIVRCSNPKCITNNEPMQTRFRVIGREPVTLRCHYCNHTLTSDRAQIL